MNYDDGEIRRVLARTYRNRGLSNKEIAKLLGVTAQHVSYMFNDARRRRARTARRDKQRRNLGIQRYACGVCGERGHNARRHESHRPEDITWIRNQ